MRVQSKSEAFALKNYFPHVLAVTFVVAALPLVAVYAIERTLGVTSYLATGLIGVALSLAVAIGGSIVWRKFGSTDLVFADLLLWGYARRLWVDRRLARMTRQYRLQVDPAELDRMSPEARAKMLADLAALIEASDPYTHGHSRRVTRHAYMIAKTMGLPKSTVDKIKLAATVHDVGKIHTPKHILHKPDRLTDEEFAVIKEHPVTGAEMVAILGDDEVTAMVRHHHERLDGRGYPDRLTGDEIPIGARVIAVADTFDAICSTRPYRPARRHMKAIDIMKKESGRQLDAAAVQAFLRYYSGRSSIGWWAFLSTVPQRVISHLLSWFQQTAVGAAAQGAAAVVTSVALVTGVPAVATFATPQVASANENGAESQPFKKAGRNAAGSPSVSAESGSAAPTDANGPTSTGEPQANPKPSPDSTETQSQSNPEPSPTPTSNNEADDSLIPDDPLPLPTPSPSPTSVVEEIVDDLLDVLF